MASCQPATSAAQEVDIVVYGATPAGIAAAVNAARAGRTVALFEPSDHLGGLVSGGMSNTDFKTFEALGGTYREFMDRVAEHYASKYGQESIQHRQCFDGVWYEPKVARQIFEAMMAEQNTLGVYPLHRLTKLKIKERQGKPHLKGATFDDIATDRKVEITAQVFIDATYEGDLMAEAGCPYRVGREGREAYGELYAGVKYYQDHRFLIGSTGEGDHRIQCYNFRLCMTDSSANRLSIRRPQGYDSTEYLPLLKLMQAGEITRVDEGIVRFTKIPNRKADVNDLMYSPFSLRLVGENYDWPDGSPAVRATIFERHKRYSLGLFYFLQHDPRVPEAIRAEAHRWGLPKDEFEAYNHFPPVLYVREARRLAGNYVLTEHHTQPAPGSVRAPVCPDAVAICDYSMDSHGNGPEIPYHPGVAEGVFNAFVVPYPISYQVMLPPELEGLLVPVAVSASHVGFSSLRMEPTWCALGQAAGLAAAQSVAMNKPLREVDIPQLQRSLYQADALTFYASDVPPASPYFEAVQFWGNRGFFAHLPEYEGVPYRGRGPKGDLPGQYIEAYPYHAVHVERPLSPNLRDQWLTLSGLSLSEEAKAAALQLSRGAFLKQLLSQSQQMPEP